MWQRLKDLLAIYKDLESLLGFLPTAFAAFNNYAYQFIPVTPLLRLQTAVSTFLGCLVAIGVMASTISDKRGSATLRPWLRKRLIWSALMGFAALGLYRYLLTVFERVSYNPSLSTFFDIAQIALFVLPFLCWSVAIVALVALFR